MKMHKETVTLDLDIPNGYEFVRYDFPKKGEEFLLWSGLVDTAGWDFKNEGKQVIVKRIDLLPELEALRAENERLRAENKTQQDLLQLPHVASQRGLKDEVSASTDTGRGIWNLRGRKK